MAINIGKLRERRNKQSGGGDRKSSDFWKPQDDTTTLLYIVPPTDEMDGIPYVEFEQYFVRAGGRSTALVSLDRRNEALWHPATKEFIDPKGLTPGVRCPIAEHRDSGIEGAIVERDEQSIQRSRRSFLFYVIPIANVIDGEVEMLPDAERVPRPYIAGFTVWDGVCEVIETEGDITNPDAAIFVRLKKKKTGPANFDVEYRVSADSNSLRKPVKLKGAERQALDEAQASGDINPFRIVGAFAKSREDMIAILRGEDPAKRVEVETYSDGYESKPKRGSIKPKPAAESYFAADDLEDDDIPFREEATEEESAPVVSEEKVEESEGVDPLDEFERELMARRKRRAG